MFSGGRVVHPSVEHEPDDVAADEGTADRDAGGGFVDENVSVSSTDDAEAREDQKRSLDDLSDDAGEGHELGIASARQQSAASRVRRDASIIDKIAAAFNIGRYLVTTGSLIYVNVGASAVCQGGGSRAHGTHQASFCAEGHGGHIGIERAQWGLAVGMLVMDALLFRYCASRRRHFPGARLSKIGDAHARYEDTSS